MANGFIGQVNIGSDTHLIGSTLFAICDTKDITATNGSNTKQAALQGSAYFSETTGATIHVKFTYANTETDSTLLKLQIASSTGYTTARPIVNYNGPITWNANSVISFTFDGTNYIINSSAIDGSSIQNLSLGNISNEGKLSGHPDSLVITNSNAEIAAGAAFETVSTQSQSTKFLRSDGTWAAPSYTTDTHYTATLITADESTDKTTAAGGTNSVYLNLVENNTVRSSHQIVGAGGTTVESDANGVITITGKSGTVTSVQVQATSPVVSSTSTASSTTLSTTISLADGYGDTKNPYGTKTANYVLAGPTSGSAAAPSFRELVEADIPSAIARVASPTFTGTPTAPTVADATDSSTNIATTAFVAAAINAKLASNDAMLFKGTIGAATDNPTITALPDGTTGKTYQAGYTYRVITAGEYAGQNCEVGDLIIATADSTSGQTAINNAHWTIAQTNIDGALYKGTTYTSGQLLVAGSSGAVSTSGYTLAAPTAAGDILYASSTTAYSTLAKGTDGQVLTLSSGVPTWADNASTTNLYVTSSTGTTNTTSALTNGNVYLRLFDVTTARDTHKISGAGGTTVTTDTSANIIITSKTYSASTTTVLNALTLKYNNGSAHTETPSTDTYVAEVNSGILYIKSIVYGTDNTVNTGFTEVTT